MILDLSVTEQIYIEDCEVCCRPVRISYVSENAELLDFEAQGIEQ